MIFYHFHFSSVGYFDIPVCKADKRFFPFQFRGDEQGDTHGLVSEIIVQNGTKYIILKTILDLKNHYIKPVNVYTFDGRSKFSKMTQIQPDETYHIPLSAVYSEPYEFYFEVDEPGKAMSYDNFKWRELLQDSNFSKNIHCSNTEGGHGLTINIQGKYSVKFEEFFS